MEITFTTLVLIILATLAILIGIYFIYIAKTQGTEAIKNILDIRGWLEHLTGKK